MKNRHVKFIENMTELNDTVLKKFINNCPKCGGELKPYSLLPGLRPVKAYCPFCDILRMHSSIPYLCVNCNSAKFYNDDREKASVIDNLVADKIPRLYDKKSFFTKRFVYREDLCEEERDKLLEEIKKLQEQRPTDICWYCGDTKFIRMKSKKLYEMERRGELKIGYKISNNFVSIRHECKENANILIRVSKTVYKATCKCGYEEYIFVPEWQQEEIKDIKIMKEEDESLDRITAEDLDMTQKIPIMTYSNEKDLLKKVKGAIDTYKDT